MNNCSSCAKRRRKIGKVVHKTWQRIITMPWHMNPEWLPSHERDNWIMHRDRALYMMGIKGKHGLRRYQRGSVSAFVQAAAAQQGAGGDCTFTESTIPNLTEFGVEPTESYVNARLHSDGDWWYNDGNGFSWGTTKGTWQGGCAVADYDTRWNRVSGDVPNSGVSGTDGVWHAATTSAALGYEEVNTGINDGSFNLECRDGASLNVLFTDVFTMRAEVDPMS